MRYASGQQGEKWAAVNKRKQQQQQQQQQQKQTGIQATNFFVGQYEISLIKGKFVFLVLQINDKEMYKKVYYTCKVVFC